jgi:tyrosinase
MNVEIDIPGTDSQGRSFLTWTPVEAKARLLNAPPGVNPVRVTLRNAGSGGRVIFSSVRSDQGSATLLLNLRPNGPPVSFFIAGEFQRPSAALGDAIVEAVGPGSAGVIGSKAVMVRVRKNAEALTAAERDRFLAALATLNGRGSGRFRDFRDMHVDAATEEEHGNTGFLPWHRAYILDFERELQAIDSSVALPYWRFDRPAPKLFTRNFIGLPNSVGRVLFIAGHPLENWQTDGQRGLLRSMGFGPNAAPFGLRTEAQTLAMGGSAPNAIYGAFRGMEGDPHGRAHTSFTGFIQFIGTAARDPLFFMLHCNVDRLWAKWQWIHRRMDPANARSFAPAVRNRVGHRLADTMWPWNGVTTAPRPSTAPGGTFASSVVTAAPGPRPLVRSMIDYQSVAGGPALGFAYDDVPFEL